MGGFAEARDPGREQIERDAFRMLEHAYRVSGASSSVAVLGSRVADALRLERGYALGIIEHLVQEGYLTYDPQGPSISISTHGVLYVESAAWRRRSVRGQRPSS